MSISIFSISFIINYFSFNGTIALWHNEFGRNFVVASYGIFLFFFSKFQFNSISLKQIHHC
jgi:hypothetical protein